MPSPGDGAKGLQWRGGDEHSGDHNRHGANDRGDRPAGQCTARECRQPRGERREKHASDERSWTPERHTDGGLREAKGGGRGAEQAEEPSDLIPLGCLIRVEGRPLESLTRRLCPSWPWSHATGAGAGGPSR